MNPTYVSRAIPSLLYLPSLYQDNDSKATLAALLRARGHCWTGGDPHVFGQLFSSLDTLSWAYFFYLVFSQVTN